MRSYASKLMDALEEWPGPERLISFTFVSFVVSCGTRIIIPWWTLRATYATSTDKPSLVRPWMLSFRRDFEPDVGSLLLQLYRAEGLVPEFVASISRQNSIQLNMDRPYQVVIQSRECCCWEAQSHSSPGRISWGGLQGTGIRDWRRCLP